MATESKRLKNGMPQNLQKRKKQAHGAWSIALKIRMAEDEAKKVAWGENMGMSPLPCQRLWTLTRF